MEYEEYYFDISDDKDDESEPSTLSAKHHCQVRVKLCIIALNSDWFGVSTRMGNQQMFPMWLTNVKSEEKIVVSELIWSVYVYLFKTFLSFTFEGRKTILYVLKRWMSSIFAGIKKEHYSLIQEPGSIYIGHVFPFSSSSTDIIQSIISHLS